MRRLLLIIIMFTVIAAGCEIEQPEYSIKARSIGSAHAIAYGPGDRLYVLNPYFDVVIRWDLASDKVRLYDVCERPEDMALAPSGGKLVVACTGDDEVSVVDIEAGEVHTIDTNPMPYSVAIDREGKRAVVAEYAGDSVLLIDLENMETRRLFVPGGPVEVAIAPDGLTAVVAAYWDNAVSLIDLEAGEVTNQLRGSPFEFERPQDLAIGLDSTQSEGLAFIANREHFDSDDRLASRIVAIDVADGSYVSEAEVGPGPKALTLSENGDELLTVNTAILEEYPAYTASLVAIDQDGELDEVYRFVVREDAVASAMVPTEDVMAVVNMGDDSLSLLNLSNLGSWVANVSIKPFGVAASPGGRFVFVVHDHPLGSISILKISDGSVTTIDSLIFKDLLED